MITADTRSHAAISSRNEMANKWPLIRRSLVEGDPAYLMAMLLSKHNRALQQALAPHDLSLAEWFTLYHLYYRGGRTASELASCSSYERSSLAKATRMLERKGLARRAAIVADRRMAAYSLTTSGHRIFESVVPNYRALRKSMLAGVSRADSKRLLRLLQAAHANHGSPPG
jgi:DNA-binding MarR family transcriptional regulator